MRSKPTVNEEREQSYHVLEENIGSHFENEDLSPKDLISIANKYQSKYGSDIMFDFGRDYHISVWKLEYDETEQEWHDRVKDEKAELEAWHKEHEQEVQASKERQRATKEHLIERHKQELAKLEQELEEMNND